jgi:3-deoxy-D-manno-octulosonate 8-phosphate phosphatase (KDO 8-P phosphatase)
MINLSRDIKYIVTDFDGVLTDGFAYLSDKTDSITKRISFKDIMGISLAIKAGLKVGIISGENHSTIDFVQNKFNLEEVHKGIKNKAEILKQIIERNHLSVNEVCFIGDDINDIEALNLIKFPVTVPEANYKVKNIPNINITQSHGGNGAFREVVDSILDAVE